MESSHFGSIAVVDSTGRLLAYTGEPHLESFLRSSAKPFQAIPLLLEGGIEEYDLDGRFTGEFHVFGEYQRPLGFGSMRIADGLAYGEMFEQATAGVLLEGSGVRLDNIQLAKGGGTGTGAAFVGWNGTYSFTFDGRNIPVETLNATARSTLPLSGEIQGPGTLARNTSG